MCNAELVQEKFQELQNHWCLQLRCGFWVFVVWCLSKAPITMNMSLSMAFTGISSSHLPLSE